MRIHTPRALCAFLLTAALSGTAAPALADGGFLTAPERIIYERSQSAFLHLEDGVEEMCVLPEFYGDAEDFVWIVPVPGLPTLDAGDEQLFIQANRMTSPVYRSRDTNWGCESNDYDYAVGNGQDGTTILADEVIGTYRTLIISSTDGADLADSLSAWGYLHAENDEAVDQALQYYVDREWYFVAIKVDEHSIGQEYSWYGLMQPVRFRFAANRMVYPLRISALSSMESSAIHLYTVGDHRMEHENFETWYANRISQDELAAIRSAYPLVGDELEAGDFLTRLTWREIRVQDMDEDIYLEVASSDTEMRLVNYSGFPLWNLFLIGSVLGWLVLRFRLWRRGREV